MSDLINFNSIKFFGWIAYPILNKTAGPQKHDEYNPIEIDSSRIFKLKKQITHESIIMLTININREDLQKT
ncbi:hypothetical protein K3495_g10387 [Podosphaera aphanis]|nr:hypothetical protein K3495_g10387 [Podosphaera aphanis]